MYINAVISAVEFKWVKFARKRNPIATHSTCFHMAYLASLVAAIYTSNFEGVPLLSTTIIVPVLAVADSNPVRLK